jgi:ribosomal protein S18 acetylase RimI-like enzyme
MKMKRTKTHIILNMVIFSFILLNTACSVFKSQEKVEPLRLLKIEEWSSELYGKMKNICLQGEGRGLYSEKEDHYSFNYESLFEVENKTWKTALYAPLHGEETFFVKYGEVPSVVEGTLVNKMKKDEMIGFALFLISKGDETAHLLKIVINKKVRGQKHGDMLLCFALYHLLQPPITQIYLEVGVSNSPAIHLNLKNHFQTLKVQKHFYSQGESALIMVLPSSAWRCPEIFLPLFEK